MNYSGKKAIVIGASSGIGREVTQLLLADGWTVGVGARRMEPLLQLKEEHQGKVYCKQIDITAGNAGQQLQALISEMGGIDLYFHAAGVGWQNPTLKENKELQTVATNGMGFARMVGAAYRYFAVTGHGHIAVISSIAGTKGLGAAPSYSATKAFQGVYLQALEQQVHIRKLSIHFTDIRPGFVRTPLLDDGSSYPLLMNPKSVARSIVKAIYHRRHVVVIDWRYRLLTFFWRLLPNALWRRMNIHN